VKGVGDPGDPAPVFRVLRGDPNSAELAALTVVLLARTANQPSVPRPVRAGWRRPERAATLRNARSWRGIG
jgi:hypothetical protein